MKKDPVKTAQEILKAFGGKENVISDIVQLGFAWK